MAVAVQTFADRLAAEVERKRSQLVVGLDPRVDALTVNPYLGRESIEPFLAAARRRGAGLFVLVKTSNAGGDVQDLQLTDGRPLWHHVATMVAEWGEEIVGEVGLSSVGAVVG